MSDVVVGDRATRADRIRAALAVLSPTEVELVDESHRHVGHAGARDGRGHFAVRIVSEAFHGLSTIARHRAIYAALGDLMQTDIHAVAIRAEAPGRSDGLKGFGAASLL